MNDVTRPTKADVRRILGLRNDAELARLLGVTAASVSLWRDRPIPQAQFLRLKYELRPDAAWDTATAAA